MNKKGVEFEKKRNTFIHIQKAKTKVSIELQSYIMFGGDNNGNNCNLAKNAHVQNVPKTDLLSSVYIMINKVCLGLIRDCIV